MNSQVQQQHIDWRRNQVIELSSKGYNQREIATKLQVDPGTISRDFQHLRRQAKENMRHYIDEELPLEYHKTYTGVTLILKEAWAAADNAVNNRDKAQSLELAQRAYGMRLDMLSNITVINQAIQFLKARKEAIENQNLVPIKPLPSPSPVAEPEAEEGEEGIF